MNKDMISTIEKIRIKNIIQARFNLVRKVSEEISQLKSQRLELDAMYEKKRREIVFGSSTQASLELPEILYDTRKCDMSLDNRYKMIGESLSIACAYIVELCIDAAEDNASLVSTRQMVWLLKQLVEKVVAYPIDLSVMSASIARADVCLRSTNATVASKSVADIFRDIAKVI